MRTHKTLRGYSLVELITVLGIVGALILAGVVSYKGYYAWGKTQADAQDLATINSAVEVLKYHNYRHAALSGANDNTQNAAVIAAIKTLSTNPIPADVVIDTSKLSSVGSGKDFKFVSYDSSGTGYSGSGGGGGSTTSPAELSNEKGFVLNGYQVTGLTGGAGNLDGVVTVGRESGIRMVVSNGGQIDAYTLVDSTAATSVPTTIRPLDYSTENARVWTRSPWFRTVDPLQNLMDLNNPSLALDNLGAGTMARQNAGAVAITGGTANFNTDGFTVLNQIGSSGGSLWLNGGMLGSYTSRATISSGGSSVGSGLTLLGPAGGQDYSIFSTGAGSSAGTGMLGFFDATAGDFRGVIDNQGDWGFGTDDPLARVTVRGRAGQAPLRIENTAGDSIFTVNADGSISGGAFDGGDIGGTTPGKGTFTDLTVTGTVTFSALPDGFLKTDSDGKISVVSGASLVSSLDLGTMASQDADAVAITGGTINGTTIGQTVAAKGKFTDLEGVNLKATGTVQFTTLTDGFLKTDVSGNTTAVSGAALVSGLGLGTMATQNADSVTITGGTINGTTIGQTTASKGKFTDLHSTGSLRHEGIGAGFMKTDSDGNVSTTGAPPDIPIGGTILYPSTAASIDGGRFLQLNGQAYDPTVYPDLNVVLVAGGLTNPVSMTIDLGLGVASRFLGFDGADRPIWSGPGGVATWTDAGGKQMLNPTGFSSGNVLLKYQSAGDGTVQPVVLGYIATGAPFQIVYTDGTTRSLSANPSFGSPSYPTYVAGSYAYNSMFGANNYINLSTGTVTAMAALPGGMSARAILADRFLGINASREVYLFDPVANSWALTATLPVGASAYRISRDGTQWGYRSSTYTYHYTSNNGTSFTSVAASGSSSPQYWRLGNSGRIFEMNGSTGSAPYHPRVWDGSVWRSITFTNGNAVFTTEDWFEDSVLTRVPGNFAGFIYTSGNYSFGYALTDGTLVTTPTRLSRSPSGTYMGINGLSFLTSANGSTFSSSGTFVGLPTGIPAGYLGTAADQSYMVTIFTNYTGSYWSNSSTGPIKLFTTALGTMRYLPNVSTNPTITGLPNFRYFIKVQN